MLADPSVPATPSDVASPMGDLRYIARQPILDNTKQLYGYELLFRSGATIACNDVNSDRASQSTLDLSLLVGAGSLTDGRRAFINCTRSSICSGVLRTLPKEVVVLEVLEDVPSDEETVRNCRELKQAGYKIAMDDIVSTLDERIPLLELADYVKTDFLLTDARQQLELARRFGHRGAIMLAEKVETHEQFHAAVSMGYTLFQGYFFCRPETMKARGLPSLHLGYLDILRRVYEKEIDIPALSRVIREEPALCYRLLRYLNSAAWGVYQVNSVVHALNLLGRDEIRKWVSMVTAISLAGPQSQELIRMALTRARFCEMAAAHFDAPTSEYFLTGLFSLLEAMLDRPLSQIVEHLPITGAIRDALNGAYNRQGVALRLAVASGRGHWEAIPALCARFGCSEQDVWHWQDAADTWVRGMLHRKNGESGTNSDPLLGNSKNPL